MCFSHSTIVLNASFPLPKFFLYVKTIKWLDDTMATDILLIAILNL